MTDRDLLISARIETRLPWSTNESAEGQQPYRRVMTATGSAEHFVPWGDLEADGEGGYLPAGALNEARSLCGEHESAWFPAEGAYLCNRCARYAVAE